MASQDFYKSIHNELFDNILPYWENHSRDTRPVLKDFSGRLITTILVILNVNVQL